MCVQLPINVDLVQALIQEENHTIPYAAICGEVKPQKNMIFEDLHLGTSKLAITPENCEHIFDAFLRHFPNFTSKDELHRMSELDEFQWWSFENLTLSQTFSSMRKTVEDFRKRQNCFWSSF